MIPLVFPFVPRISYFTRLIASVRRSIYLLLTLPTTYEKEMELLRKLLAEIETDEDSDFENEDNEPENNLKENYPDHECFSEHDTVSEEYGESGNEKMNNSECSTSTDSVQWRKTKI
ncbi:hypothetical protein AVEN_165631-1 [Araneus ventricosus]|uniref:Uncharacterized protein n=1 Tax=Araneus ventricosus TaxID=182803 RepID=A0A4Y2IJ04_ARAVE|nr:hypothetical protein AVEN_165631-1 [Araneus ventricosus]